jgi:excisionase family DNA binding protein
MTSAMETKQFLSAQESYSLLGISKAYFYKLKKETGLPVFTIGGKRTLFKRSDLENLIHPK